MSSSTTSRLVSVFDFGPVLDCTQTPIPASGSATLTLIASLGDSVQGIDVIDVLGSYAGIYSGAPGLEHLEAIIGGGGRYILPVLISTGVRISIKSLYNSPIASGSICCGFLGV